MNNRCPEFKVTANQVRERLVEIYGYTAVNELSYWSFSEIVDNVNEWLEDYEIINLKQFAKNDEIIHQFADKHIHY